MTDFTLEPLENDDDKEKNKEKPYPGINRRMGERRQNSDRRDEARFTVGAIDRRSGEGRRSNDLNVKKKIYGPKTDKF